MKFCLQAVRYYTLLGKVVAKALQVGWRGMCWFGCSGVGVVGGTSNICRT